MSGFSDSSPPHTPSLVARYVPALVLAIGIALSVVSTTVAYFQAQDREGLRLKLIIERVKADTTEQLGTYVSLVRSAVGFFEASNLQVSPLQFRKFLAAIELQKDYPGILAIGYIEKVPAARRADFEAEQRRYSADFRIFPDTPRDPYYVATYVEPEGVHRQRNLGFDPHTEPVRRAAMEKARDTASPVMTGRLILRTEESSEEASPAFILYAPIYRISPPPNSLEERRQALHGFIAASFRVNDLLKGIRSPTARSQVAFRIFAGDTTDPREVLMVTEDFPTDRTGVADTETISVAGFTWTFEFVTLPDFEVESGMAQVPMIGGLGLLLSFLLYGFTTVQARARHADERALHYERQRAKDLQDLSRAKTRFFSNLSHELRTPLNGILGMNDLLWDTPLNEQQKDYLTTIGTCGRTLLDLISDVLDVSKIEAGKLELKRKPFKLLQPFTGALEVVRGQARGKDLSLHLEWDEKLPRYVEGDLVRLRQVLVNLLSNAVKFTRAGSVTVRARDREGQLEVEIQDTGVGISKENVAKLFRPFSQVTVAEGVETVQGTGLGLVICKEIVSLMGGSIDLTSELGVGTVFKLRLPLTVVDADKYESVTEPQMSEQIEAGLCLLVADDNPVNLRVLLLQLHKLGYTADGAEDGHKVLEAVAQKHYDLILMDCQMPRMDGLEATRAIRADHPDGPVIVALTAHTGPEQQAECEAAGMDDFLTKPIELARLVQVLEKWQVRLKANPDAAASRAASSPPAPPASSRA
jgi:signal transduction histidine kinase/CheY-like chemotaxis protein